jgi:hypothetical protein
VVDKHQEVFTPPRTWKGEPLGAASGGEGDHDHDGRGFDMVFDLTGETAAEKPELVSASVPWYPHPHERPDK